MLHRTRVANTRRKIHSKNEKNLQGYMFAKLYFQVKDFKTAERYLSDFLEIRDCHAPAHKLMGQIHETNNNLEDALLSYKRSLEIDPHQNEVVLKICGLCIDLPVDYTTALYWADRAEELYPFHKIVFRLRVSISDEDRNRFNSFLKVDNIVDKRLLENLIATELVSQPENISSTIRLLRLYLDTKRLKEAYDYAITIESKGLFPWNVEWYYLLKDIFEAYQEEYHQDLDSQFYLQYLTALDHLILLTLAEPHSLPCGDEIKQYSMKDALSVLFIFDKILGSSYRKDFKDDWWNYFICHMKGQICFYLLSLLLKQTKMHRGIHKEVLQYCSVLAEACYTFKPVNLLEETWFLQMDKHRKTFEKIFEQGSLRTSVIGHIVCQEDKDIWQWELKPNLNFSSVRQRIYYLVMCPFTFEYFGPSYFLHNFNHVSQNLEFPSCIGLQEYDKAAYKLCPDSLHHLVWFELHRQASNGPVFSENVSEIFKGLQYSNENLYNGSYETLCILDLEAYLFASVYQAQTNLEKKNAVPNPKIVVSHLSFPPNVADALCSKKQASWWRAAYALHNCSAKEKFGEFRLELQHGLEVIRGIGNHSVEIQLIAYLARMFADKAEYLMKNLGSGKNERKLIPQNIAAVQSRSLHYWNIVLQTLRTPKEQFFTGFNNALTKDDIRGMEEDGKLYVAVHFFNSGKLDEAAELLSTLSTPYGSYHLALTLKRLASQEGPFSKTKDALLSRAKRAIIETRDRLKDDKNHSSHQELHALLDDIETELAIDLSMNYFHGFEDIDVADVYDSSPKLSSLLYNTPSTSRTTLHSTHSPSGIMSVRTKNQPTDQEYNEQLTLRLERMEAEVKALTFNQNTFIKPLVGQQKSLLETNKSIYEAVMRNTKILKLLKKSIDELQTSETGSKEKDPCDIPNHKDHGDEDSNTNKSFAETKISQAKNAYTDTSKLPNHHKSQDDKDSSYYVLFEDRAELSICVDQGEWKKYDISTIKILHNEVSGLVRLLIRDQYQMQCNQTGDSTYCLVDLPDRPLVTDIELNKLGTEIFSLVKNVITIKNHYLASDVKIKPSPFSSQAWSWNAQDFADGELRPALFCAHFGTVQLFVAFKAAFDAAFAISKDNKDKKVASLPSTLSPSSSETFQFSKTGLWTCPSYTNTTTSPPITAQFSNRVSVPKENATTMSTTTVTSSFQFLNSSCNVDFINSTLNNNSGNQNIDCKISQANMTTSPLFGKAIQEQGNKASIAISSVGNSYFHESNSKFSACFYPKSLDTITKNSVIKTKESVEKKLQLESDASLDINGRLSDCFSRLSLGCWKCEACQFENNADRSKCVCCSTYKNCNAAASSNSIKNSDVFSFSSPSAPHFEIEVPINTDGIAPSALQTAHPFVHLADNTKDNEVARFAPSLSLRNATTSFCEKFQIQGNKATSSPSLEVQDSNSRKPSSDKCQFSVNFKPQVDLWECQSCLLQNKAEETKCELCGTDKSELFSTKSFEQFIGLNICSQSSPRTQDVVLGKVKNPSESTSGIKVLSTALPGKIRLKKVAVKARKNSDGSGNNEKEEGISFENIDNANNQEKKKTVFEKGEINYEGIRKEKEISCPKWENYYKQWNVANEERVVEKEVFPKCKNGDADGSGNNEKEEGISFENIDNAKNQEKKKTVFEKGEINYEGIRKEKEISYPKWENYYKQWNVANEERVVEKEVFPKCKNGDADGSGNNEKEEGISFENIDNANNQEKKKTVFEKGEINYEGIRKEKEISYPKWENYYKQWNVANEERVVEKEVFPKCKNGDADMETQIGVKVETVEREDDANRVEKEDEMPFMGSENYDKHRNVRKEKITVLCEIKNDTGWNMDEIIEVSENHNKHRNIEKEKRIAFLESKNDNTDGDIEKQEGMAFRESVKNDTDRNFENVEERFLGSENSDKNWSVESKEKMAFGESKDDAGRGLENEVDLAFGKTENNTHTIVENRKRREFGESKKDDADRHFEKVEDVFEELEKKYKNVERMLNTMLNRMEFSESKKNDIVRNVEEKVSLENEHVDTDADVAKWKDLSFEEELEKGAKYKNVEKENRMELFERKKNGTDRNVENKERAFMEKEYVDSDTNVAKWGEIENVGNEQRKALGKSKKDDTDIGVAFVESENDKHLNIAKEGRIEFWISKKDDINRNVRNKEDAFMDNERIDTDKDLAKCEEMSFGVIKKSYTNKDIEVEENVVFVKSENDLHRYVEKGEIIKFRESKKHDSDTNVENKEEAYVENERIDADKDFAKWDEISFEEIEISHKDGNVEKEGEMTFGENKKDIEVGEDVVFMESENDLHSRYVEKEEIIEFRKSKRNGSDTDVENKEEAFVENEHIDTYKHFAKWDEISFEKIEISHKDGNVEKEGEMAFGGKKKDIEVGEDVVFMESENDLHSRYVEKEEIIEFRKSKRNGSDTDVENKEEACVENEHVTKWGQMSFVEIKNDNQDMGNKHVNADVVKWEEMSFKEIENKDKYRNVENVKIPFVESKDDRNKDIGLEKLVASGEIEIYDEHLNIEVAKRDKFLESKNDYIDRNMKRVEMFVKCENDGNLNVEKEETNVLYGSKKEDTDKNSEKMEETAFKKRENKNQDRNIEKEEEIAFEKRESHDKYTNIKGETTF